MPDSRITALSVYLLLILPLSAQTSGTRNSTTSPPSAQTSQQSTRPPGSRGDQPGAIPPALRIRMTYLSFIRFMGEDHARVQREIREAHPGDEPIVEGRNYCLMMDIRPEDYQMLLVLVVQAAQRIGDNEHESNRLLDKWRRDHSGEDLRRVDVDPRVIALGVQHDAIVDQFEADLKQELGDETFMKVDKFVRENWGDLRVLRRIPHPLTGIAVEPPPASQRGGSK